MNEGSHPQVMAFREASFFFATPALVSIYAGFLTASHDGIGGLWWSIFFAAAFTMPGWWFAWATCWGLGRTLGHRLPLLATVALGYVVSLFLFRPYYNAVYEVIALVEPGARPMVEARRYGFDWASARAFVQVNAPGLVIWTLVNWLYLRLMGFAPCAAGAMHGPVPSSAVPRAERPMTLPRFAEGLGLGDVRDILFLQAEEHYLRVGGPRRSHLVRYRMRDAVAELPPELGLRVHRSYWVARHAVRRVEPAGKSLVLTLEDGTRVPVSLAYREAARQAGLSVAGVHSCHDGAATAH